MKRSTEENVAEGGEMKKSYVVWFDGQGKIEVYGYPYNVPHIMEKLGLPDHWHGTWSAAEPHVVGEVIAGHLTGDGAEALPRITPELAENVESPRALIVPEDPESLERSM
jgi:hypothetical protein